MILKIIFYYYQNSCLGSFNKAWHKQVEVKQSETSTESETPHKKLNWISCLQDSESDGDSSLGNTIILHIVCLFFIIFIFIK